MNNTMHIDPFPPIEQVTRPNVPTKQAAYYLDRSEMTLRLWSHSGKGPIEPLRVGGRLAWPVAELRRIMGVTA